MSELRPRRQSAAQSRGPVAAPLCRGINASPARNTSTPVRVPPVRRVLAIRWRGGSASRVIRGLTRKHAARGRRHVRDLRRLRLVIVLVPLWRALRPARRAPFAQLGRVRLVEILHERIQPLPHLRHRLAEGTEGRRCTRLRLLTGALRVLRLDERRHLRTQIIRERVRVIIFSDSPPCPPPRPPSRSPAPPA